MIIVPKGGNLVVQANLLNGDVGLSRDGQSVAVSFPSLCRDDQGADERMGLDAGNGEKLRLVFSVRVTQERVAAGKAPCGEIAAEWQLRLMFA
jgi:hypothetical protein